MNESDRLQEGQLFGRYQIVRLLGEGGMGAVYEATHTVLKKRVALKTLLPSLAEVPEARARFLREAEAASRINHPHVVDVSDVGTVEELPFLVMEFLEGQTLGDMMAARGRLDVAEAVDLMLPVISAVAAGHDQRVIHRDLKPQNVFLARGPWGEMTPKVLDFGASKIIEEAGNIGLTATMTVLGTAMYMSPEQARGAKQVDKQSDQYALGLILYEMITATKAHPGDNPLEVLHHVTNGRITPPRDLRPDLPVELEFVLLRMLASESGGRFPSLRAVGRELLPFASDRARLNLKAAFREPTETAAPHTPRDARTPAAGSPPVAASRPSVAASAPRAGAARAAALPPAPDPADTTFRRAAAETHKVQTRPAGRGPLLAAALAVAGAGAVALLVWFYDQRSPALPPVAGTEAVERPVSAAAPPPAAPTAPEPEAAAAIETILVDCVVFPEEADIALDGARVAQGRVVAKLPANGSRYTITVSAPGYETKVVTFGPGVQPPSQIRLRRASEAARAARPRRRKPPPVEEAPAAAPAAEPAEPTSPPPAESKSDQIDKGQP